ncbi:MAG: signal peptidase I [Monoglobales bacterium]
MESNEKKSMGKEIFEWVQAIVVAFVIAMFLRTYVFTLVDVNGSSMVPTLHDRDKLFVWRLGYEPQVGDIVIFRPAVNEDTPYVKRVIATEGQSVDLKFNEQEGYVEVYVDGDKLEEDYINEKIEYIHIGNGTYPCVVPDDCIFVMGDNRNHSSDSRLSSVGMVKKDSLIGKATAKVWPASDIRVLK